jgi:CheY-like chemotaxis protein
VSKAILCVDDEVIILMAIKLELRNAFGSEFVYETASDGAEALELMESLMKEGVRVVVVISDWLMPGMKGDELVIEIQRRYPDIQAMIVTGQADDAKIEQLRRNASLSAVIGRPWRVGEIVSAVQACIERMGSA